MTVVERASLAPSAPNVRSLAARLLLPRWWAALSAAGALVASVGMVGFAESGYLYPDVQQQWSAQVLVLWLLVTVGTATVAEVRR
jgi:hypothetical protein